MSHDTEIAAVRDLLRRLCTWSGLDAERLGASSIEVEALYRLRIVGEVSARTGLDRRLAAVEAVRATAMRLPPTQRLIADMGLALGLMRDHTAHGLDVDLLYAPNLGIRRDYLIRHWRLLHEIAGAEHIPAPPTPRSLRARPEREAFSALASLLVAPDSEVTKAPAVQPVRRTAAIGSIVVVGEVAIDRILRVRSMPKAGTAEPAQLLRHPGGKGFYRAVCAANLGLDVQLIAAVGSDPDSYWILDFLHTRHVGTELVEIIDGPAPETVVLVADDGTALYLPLENRIRLTAGDMHAPGRRAALAGTDVVLITLEPPVPAIVAALQEIRSARRAGRGPLVVLHPSPPALSPQDRRGLLGVLDTVDYIVGTTWELRQMLPDAVDVTDPDLLAARLQGLRVVTVCVIENYRCVVRSDAGHVGISAARAATLEDSPGARSAFAAALAYRLVLAKRPAQTEDFRWATAAMIATQNYLEEPGSMPTVEQIDQVLHLAVEEF